MTRFFLGRNFSAWHKFSSGLGIRKVRLTGGEPLVRDGLEDYIAYMKESGRAGSIHDHQRPSSCRNDVKPLIAAGLHRINISLDSLDPLKFEKITRTRSY